MRAMKAALLWTLGVAAVLLTPTAAVPASAATFARPVTSISSGQQATRPSPASTQRSGVPDAPSIAVAKAGSTSGFSNSGVPGDRAQPATIAPATAHGPSGGFDAEPRVGLEPGAHLGRSPPTALRA